MRIKKYLLLFVLLISTSGIIFSQGKVNKVIGNWLYEIPKASVAQ